jgi:hypothetical protein
VVSPEEKVSMTKNVCRLLLVVCLSAMGSAASAAAFTFPLINSATYDAGTQVLTLSGENLTESSRTPTVEFNGAPLTVTTASAARITAMLSNTTAPGSYLLVVHRSAFEFDAALFVVTIDAVAAQGPAGPMGPSGLPGSQGPQGLQGPKGDKGGLTSFNDVNGVPCSVGGTAATMSLSFASNGVATLTCNVPPPPPSLLPDGFNNTFGTAVPRGSVSCGAIVAANGTTFPAGTEDWFVFTWAPQCGPFGTLGGSATVTLTADLNILFDIRTDATTNIVSGSHSGSWNLSSAGTYYIRIYGATPAVVGTWAMTIAVQ